MSGARAAIVAHLGTRQVSRVLYGSIIGLALVVALEAHPPRSVAIAATLVATAIAVGLAELYSEIVGHEARTRERVARHHVRNMLADIAAVFFGVAFPSLFFFLAALDVFDRDTAFALAKWSGLGLIGAYGFAAARLGGDTALRSLRRGAMAALVAAFLIAIKALLH
jgi:VIT1/CCC1 family predicted Fe2+/Mn2+ transporter